MKRLAPVSIRLSEQTSLNGTMLLYMLLVTWRISAAAAAQHYRFQLIVISADVASLPHESGSFLCKLKPIGRERETWKAQHGQNVACFRLIVVILLAGCSES